MIVDDIEAPADEAQRAATLKWFSDLFGVPVEAFVSLDSPTYTYERLTALPDCAYRRAPGADLDDGDQDTRL